MAIGFSAPAWGGAPQLPQLPQLLHPPSPPPQPGDWTSPGWTLPNPWRQRAGRYRQST